MQREDSFSELLPLKPVNDNTLPLITSKAKLSPRKKKMKPFSFPKVGLGAECKSGKNLPNLPRTYRYKILPGNNCRVVMFALKKRPWWHAILNNDDDVLAQAPTFIWEMYRNSQRYKDSSYENILLNHMQRNSCLVTKKGLYLCLKAYCTKNNIDLLQIIPRTFYLASGMKPKSMKEDDMDEFVRYNDSLTSSNNNNDNQQTNAQIKENTVWILKPASRTNRGFGIKVIRGFTNVLNIVNRTSSSNSRFDDDDDNENSNRSGGNNNGINNDKENSTNANNNNNPLTNNPLTKAAKRIASQDGWIVQKYMDAPLLVSGRKFDIRCFVLVTHTQKKGLKAYFYQEAYVRTSSKKYCLDKLQDRETHLTNDAVQKHSKTYGKFEDSNKLSFQDWQQVINNEYPNAPPNVVFNHIFPEIRRLSKLTIQAAFETLSNTDINKSFELFGYDYMVDENFNVVLIEINTNPCLEFVNDLLTNLITELIDNTVRIAIDPEFPPPSAGNRTKSTEDAIELIESAPNKFDPLYP